MAKLSIGRRWHIVHLRSVHRSPASIAKLVKCSKKTVYFWLARHRETGGVDCKRVEGRPVELCTAARRRAVQLLTSDEVGGAKRVAIKLKAEKLARRVVSSSTVLRGAKQQARLDGDPLLCLRGKPLKRLTVDTMKKRLAFAKANINRDWSKVMITDRCKFPFRNPGCKVKRVRWTLKSKKHESGAYTPTHPSVLNVYAGITQHGVTKMHPVTGTTHLVTDFLNKAGKDSRNITAAEYRHVLTKTLLPEGKRIFGQKGETQWVFQQDGDPAHGAFKPVLREFNRNSGNTVQLLEHWPPNSPDLSPIENVWGWVQAEVAEQGCKTYPEFEAAVQEAFRKIPIAKLEKLMKSIPKRLERVIQTNGGKCGY